MSSTTTTLRGRFLWYDLMTTDPDAAESFYKPLIGWNTTPWEGGEKPYTMWTNGETPLGGVMELPEEARQAGAPPHWLSYIGTPNVDETVANIEKLGGTVVVPGTDIPTVGRFAVAADPHEAVFAVFTPAGDPPGHEGPTQVREFSWHELATTDHEAAFRFYHELFGWEKTDAADMGEIGTYQMFGRNGATLGGMYNKPDSMPAPPHWLYYITVGDINSSVEQVKALGGQVLNGPMEVPGGDFVAQCMDPQNAAFALHEAAS